MSEIKSLDFRIDGRLHDYAVYYIGADGSKTYGYAESMSAYNPGEVVELLGGQKCVIDFEL